VIIFFSLQLGNISFDYARMRVGIAKGEKNAFSNALMRCGYGTTFLKERSQ
jgi:hypothetical protein